MDQNRDLNAAIEAIEGDSPAELRRSVAEIFRQAVEADLAAFSRYSLDQKGDYFTSVQAVGADTAVELFENQASGEPDSCSIWDPRYPPKEAEQKFDVSHYDGEPEFGIGEDERPCEVYREIDVWAEASALLYENSCFVGCMAVFRTERGMFSDADVETLDGLIESATERLIEAEQREVELLDDKPARILVNPKRLQVEAATGNAFTWLSNDRRERLLEQIDSLDVADSYPVKLIVDGYAVWVTQMSGDLGMRLLATVERRPMPEKQPDAVLTPRQREVAGYAAAGATNREIAETLEITPDTVSDHLSEAYERLGVANRVELALILTTSE